MISLRARIRMALKVLRSEPFEMFVEPYHRVDKLKEDYACDVKALWDGDCPRSAKVCMSRTTAKFEISEDDHVHVCFKHARRVKGTWIDARELEES